MSGDFAWSVFMPFTLVASSIYALIFRLPAVLSGKAREEYFLYGFIGALVLLYAAGIVISLISLEVWTALILIFYLMLKAALLYTIAGLVLVLCRANPVEYFEFIRSYPRGWIASNVYSGVRDALRDYEAERSRRYRSRR